MRKNFDFVFGAFAILAVVFMLIATIKNQIGEATFYGVVALMLRECKS